MDPWLSSIARSMFAEEQLRWPSGGSGEGDDTLMRLINDAMTSWWAQAIAIAMYAAIALLLYRSLRRQGDGSGPRVERGRARIAALGVLGALAVLVVVAASLRPGGLVLVEYVILFTVLAYLIIRNIAPAVLGAGGAIIWALSPLRRRQMREAVAAEADARRRGTALEHALGEALDGTRAPAPRAPA